MKTNKQPIGVFDSGLGGLTVLKYLNKKFPNESFIYFGDTEHVPYGNKSAENIISYTAKICEFLISKKVKLIIIACNTASAIALNYIKKHIDIPIFGVIIPCIKDAILNTKNNRIGIIGTYATISSRIYSNYIIKQYPKVKIFEKSCPLFVPLVEEGWNDSQITVDIAKIYLKTLTKHHIDTLILGCTHYPLLKNTLRTILGKNIKLISSEKSMSKLIFEFLKNHDLLSNNSIQKNKFYVTDLPQKFNELGSRFLNEKLINVKHIELK